MKQVSIIIVTYNSEKDIFDCVASIEEYADIPKQDIELIVVDNCSREPDVMFDRLRQQWGEDIVLIKNTRNGGYGQGNNVGIRQATAPVVLIMNPDVRLISPFFKRPLMAFHEDPKLVMYGMKQMYTPSVPSTNSFWVSIYRNGYLRCILTPLCGRLDWYISRLMYVSGSCFYVRKEMFVSVGMFDEEVFMYGEEGDIHYRLTRKFGYHIQYDKSIRYIHLMLGRKPDLKYEAKMLEVDMFHYNKKGIPVKKCLKNYLRINNVLLLRSLIRKVMHFRFNAEEYEVLRQMRKLIKTKLYEC